LVDDSDDSDNSEYSDYSVMTSNTKISLNDKKIKKKSVKKPEYKSSEKITLELLNKKVIKLTKTVDELKNKMANIYSSYGNRL
jgi:hypothetical protein